jgi:hypothetical protein
LTTARAWRLPENEAHARDFRRQIAWDDRPCPRRIKLFRAHVTVVRKVACVTHSWIMDARERVHQRATVHHQHGGQNVASTPLKLYSVGS